MKFANYGTINVQLSEPIKKTRAHYWVLDEPWTPVGFGGQPWPQSEKRFESFGFIKAQFEYPPGGKQFEVWIVMPDGASRSNDRIEILAKEQIGGSPLPYGSQCRVLINNVDLIERP